MSVVLRHQVQIKQPVMGRGEYGGEQVESYDVFLNKARARVRVVSAKEEDQADQTQNPIVYEVILRYRPGITENMVVVWKSKFGDKSLNIKGIKPDVKQVYLTLLCEAA
ncbi:phage head closure protein [Aliamphritea hakodatensis]|uniref:phage head closure protein n=1 Tax=Aliamphritea hakodatensis TaxID=2895352 RepID=UPI0022FD7667|nr:phage head closure protein [Aliamphritea hakodatensis]